MLPTELITGPLAVTVGLIVALLAFLRLAARFQDRTQHGRVAPKGSTFSQGEKTRALGFTQSFLFGAACALFAVILFILHERSILSQRQSGHIAQTGILAESSQKVR